MKNISAKFNKKPSGFTLIELLITIAILSVIGTIVLSILFISLRVSKKSNISVKLKQNGNIALSQIVKNIRYAKSLDMPLSCPVPPGSQSSSITITSILDDGKTIFSCTSGSPATIASNEASLVDTSTVVVTSCSFTCSQANLNDPPTIGINFVLNSKNSNSFTETKGSVSFQSSVLMRNLNK